MKVYKLYLLSLLSGLLLALGWFPHGSVGVLFIAFVPLLIVEDTITKHQYKRSALILFGCCYLAFFTWNILTTWWLKNASYGGAAMAMFANSLLMTLVIMLVHKVKKRVGEQWRSFILICFWITFEFFHHRWDLTYPWLTLGNAFADSPNWVQWYEYTGVFGGSLWVLGINCFVFYMFRNQEKKFKKRRIVLLVSLLVVPLLLSFFIASIYGANQSMIDKIAYHKVVIVQPNIDPYNEKFVYGDYANQLDKMLKLALLKTDSTTDYLLFPETALQENIWENKLSESQSLHTLKEFVKQFPKLKIIIGANTAKTYSVDETPSVTARKFADNTIYYDDYNTAFQIDTSKRIQIYHKSKLVPGVEKMPFPFIFKYFEKFAISLGGTTGSYGTQEERTVFTSVNGNEKTAPVICYESVYGEYVSEYINNGAQFISIITNDGWWGDSPGYHQHLKYGALRAIETRRWIARSANTGISCFISPLGEIQQATDWWMPAVISGRIQLRNELTFYTRFGDYIARIAMWLSLLLILNSWLIRFKIIKS